MDKLKPCQFCGSEEITLHKAYAYELGGCKMRFYAVCMGCHTQGGATQSTRKDAIAAWNRRVGDD